MELVRKLAFVLLVFLTVCVSAQAGPASDLIVAADHGETNTVQQLLDQGADASAPDSYGITALM